MAQSNYDKKYKCPYCEQRLVRTELAKHIEKNHSDMIPEGDEWTAARIAFNTINKKSTGSCIICRKETKWNEDKQRYERICDSKQCKDKYKKMCADRLMKAKGVTKEDLLNNPEFQNKMLNNRKISGKYKFADGGEISYVGSYEKKFLEFMDVFMHLQSTDIQAPGPVVEYTYQGQTHKWITDFYYAPYNLVLDIKDGGKNPNTRDMKSYRDKQIQKEKAIKSQGIYNYLRLTDNQFDQLLETMLELKESLIDYDMDKTDLKTAQYKRVIKINEASIEPNYKTIIFDFGGVLVDANIYDDLKKEGFTDDEIDVLTELNLYVGNTLTEISSEEDYRKMMIDKCPYSLLPKLKKYMEIGVSSYYQYWYTKPLLKKLKQDGYKIYYLSNWGKWHFEKMVDTGVIDFLDLFDGGIVSYQVNMSKPDPKIYKALLNKYKIIPESALFIDDKYENIMAAELLGIHGLVMTKSITDSLLLNTELMKSKITYAELEYIATI